MEKAAKNIIQKIIREQINILFEDVNNIKDTVEKSKEIDADKKGVEDEIKNTGKQILAKQQLKKVSDMTAANPGEVDPGIQQKKVALAGWNYYILSFSGA